MIIQTTNLQEIRNQIKKAKSREDTSKKPLGVVDEIVVKAGDEEFNRKVLEIKGVNILLGAEIHDRKDKLKQRDSGLNEFLCKLAAKNNIKIALDIAQLQKLQKKEKAKALARIIQNIQLCKRTKTHIILYPEGRYKKQDIIAFITTLKGSTEQGR